MNNKIVWMGDTPYVTVSQIHSWEDGLQEEIMKCIAKAAGFLDRAAGVNRWYHSYLVGDEDSSLRAMLMLRSDIVGAVGSAFSVSRHSLG